MHSQYTISTLDDLLRYVPLQNIVPRLLAGLDIAGPDDCWLWLRAKNEGYGQIAVKKLPGSNRNLTIRTHRLMWIIVHHEIPEGLMVVHLCEERYAPGDWTGRACCNPAHLKVGSNSFNVLDYYKNGRFPKRIGEKHWNARFSDEQILTIRGRYARGESITDLAHEFGTSKTNMCDIVHGVSWPHLSGATPTAKTAYERRRKRSFLTPTDVPDILRRRANGETYKSIAATYGCQYSRIAKICKKGGW